MKSVQQQVLGPLLFFFFFTTTALAETFHFEIDVDSMDCDDPTIYEAHLKAFNLECIDGFGCDRGAGVIGAAAHVGEHAIPTAVHILVHGCHLFDQECPEDEFDGYIDICDDVAGIALEDQEFCSGFEKEGRFGIGIPFPHSLNPLSPIGVPDIEDVVVEFTFDETNFCTANFAVTLEEGLVAGLLGLGAPLVGIGVSFLLGATLVTKYLKKNHQITPINLQVLGEELVQQPKKDSKKGVSGKTTPATAAARRGGDEEENNDHQDDYSPPTPQCYGIEVELVHQSNFDHVRQAHFDHLRKTRDARQGAPCDVGFVLKPSPRASHKNKTAPHKTKVKQLLTKLKSFTRK